MPGWRVVRRGVDNDQQLVEGLRVTSPARTVSDLARVLPLAEAVAAADGAVRQRLVGEHELREVLRTCFGRGCAGPRAAGHLIDPQAESVLESVGRVEFHLGGLPVPQSPYVVRDARGGFVARTDLAWPEAKLIVELDGFAFHNDRAAAQRDRDRTNSLVLLGWRVIRFGWDDVRRRPQWCVAVVREALGLVRAA